MCVHTPSAISHHHHITSATPSPITHHTIDGIVSLHYHCVCVHFIRLPPPITHHCRPHPLISHRSHSARVSTNHASVWQHALTFASKSERHTPNLVTPCSSTYPQSRAIVHTLDLSHGRCPSKKDGPPHWLRTQRHRTNRWGSRRRHLQGPDPA